MTVGVVDGVDLVNKFLMYYRGVDGSGGFTIGVR